MGSDADHDKEAHRPPECPGRRPAAGCSPRGLARRQAILDTAVALFLEKGYEATSLSDILARSKGSRSTLYDQFGNKIGLLRAMVEEMTADVWPAIHENVTGDPMSEEALVKLGVHVAVTALSPRAVSVFRILVTESPRVPEIAELFYERGPCTVEHLLAERFAASPRTAGIPVPAEHLAQLFLGGVIGILHSRRLLGVTEPPALAEIRAHVEIAVRLFLGGLSALRPPETPPAR